MKISGQKKLNIAMRQFTYHSSDKRKPQANSLVMNNHGGSLIMVIIACLFILTLGSIVVSAAVKNYEMKNVDKNSKANFYSAEAALDEIRAGLVEDASEELANAYEITLTQYSTLNKAMRNAKFATTFTDGMKNVLLVQPDVGTTAYVASNAILSGYLKETKLDSNLNGAMVTGKAYWEVVDKEYIVIKNIIVDYTYGDYSTRITTDIKLLLPKISFENLNGYLEVEPFMKYALIADDSLWAGSISNTVTGSVYAGPNGINISGEGNLLQFSDGRIISGGNITVKDKAILNGLHTEVWATNLITTQTDKSAQQSIETKINISGDIYMKDDLILDAKSSNVALTGQYFGYSCSDSVSNVTPANNSAIMINASNALLNLGGLQKLYLAGRAFISMDNSQVTYEPDSFFGAGDDANSDILTGDSLVVKGSQGVYLVPGQYLVVGHNPISWDEYKLYYNSTTPKLIDIPADAIVFSNPYISAEQSKLMYYLNSSEPYKKVFYKFSTNPSLTISNMVYFYLNFASEKKATTYFKNFRICFPDVVFDGYPINEIILNDTSGAVIAAGNLMTSEDNEYQILDGNNSDFLNNYKSQYTNLYSTLQKFTSKTGTLFQNLINVNTLKTDAASNGGQAVLIDNGSYYVNVIDGDFPLNDPGKSGIILATGNVDVNQSFTGMIISGGEIRLYGGANVTANAGLVKTIFVEHPELKKYFTEYNGTEVADSDWNKIKVSELISYENWKKN